MPETPLPLHDRHPFDPNHGERKKYSRSDMGSHIFAQTTLLPFLTALLCVGIAHPTMVRIAHLKDIVDVPDARDGEAGLLCCAAEADVTHAADGGIEVADGDQDLINRFADHGLVRGIRVTVHEQALFGGPMVAGCLYAPTSFIVLMR